MAYGGVFRRKSVEQIQAEHEHSELKRSLGRLTEYRFEWILPGHGHSVHLPATEMSTRLRALVDRM